MWLIKQNPLTAKWYAYRKKPRLAYLAPNGKPSRYCHYFTRQALYAILNKGTKMSKNLDFSKPIQFHKGSKVFHAEYMYCLKTSISRYRHVCKVRDENGNEDIYCVTSDGQGGGGYVTNVPELTPFTYQDYIDRNIMRVKSKRSIDHFTCLIRSLDIHHVWLDNNSSGTDYASLFKHYTLVNGDPLGK